MACQSCGQRARIAGLSASNAIVVGAANGAAVVAHLVNKAGAAGSLPVGTRVWLTGDGVDDAVESGLFSDITSTVRMPPANPNTVYWVGSRGFTNLARAQAVSNETGVEIRTEAS